MAIDSQWSSVSLLCPFSDDLTDARLKRTVTAFGNAALLSTVGTPFGAGKSCHFDGTGDYLTVPDYANWAFGTGDFSVEAWVYMTAFPGGGTNNDCCIWYVPGTPQFFFYIDNTTGKPTLWNGTAGVTGSTAITLNSWNLVGVKRASSTLSIWLNGSSIASSGSYTTNFAAYTGVTIGGLTASRFLNGYISNLRITPGSGRDMSVVPTVPFPRPTVKGTVYDETAAPVAKTVLVRNRRNQVYLGGANSDPTTGIYTFYTPSFDEVQVVRVDGLYDPPTDECVFDFDPSFPIFGTGGTLFNVDHKHRILTWYGNAKVNADGVSIELDGSGDCVQATSQSFALGTDDFCVDVEFYPIAGGHGSTNSRILQIGPNSTAGTLVINTEASSNPMQIRAQFYDGATYQTLGTFNSATLANSTWHKLQLRRVSGVFTLTVNDTTWQTSGTTSYNITATALSIGANTAQGESFYGRIGKVRISIGSRRAAAAIPAAQLLTMPPNGGSGENAAIYDRVIPG